MPPVTPCHDRHGGARFIWAPCVFPTVGRNARLSALHRGDFWLPARAPRCSGFPPVSCGDLIRRIGSYGPEDRVLGPPQARLQPQPHPPDSHGLAPPYGIASRKLPSWARLGRYINDLQPVVTLYLRFAFGPDICIEVRLRSLN